MSAQRVNLEQVHGSSTIAVHALVHRGGAEDFGNSALAQEYQELDESKQPLTIWQDNGSLP